MFESITFINVLQSAQQQETRRMPRLENTMVACSTAENVTSM
jgi:hypothetical protein